MSIVKADASLRISAGVSSADSAAEMHCFDMASITSCFSASLS